MGSTQKSGKVRWGERVARKNPCPVPGCPNNIMLDSPFGVCAKHTQLFSDMNYYFKRSNQEQQKARKKGVRPGERVTEGGLILPH